MQADAFEFSARVGFVARGVIYAIIGVLAVKLALGVGGKSDRPARCAEDDRAPAVRQGAPRGWWRSASPATRCGGSHAPPSGTGPKAATPASTGGGTGKRHRVRSGLCAIAVEMLLGSRTSGSGNPHKAAAGVLGWPGGTWLVGVAGVLMIGVGLYQGYRGVSQDFLQDSKTEQMSAGARKLADVDRNLRALARMVVFGLIGIFLIKAAVDYGPAKAVGVDGALAKLSNSSHGSLLLGIVAFGLIAFALYSFTDARYRRI